MKYKFLIFLVFLLFLLSCTSENPKVRNNFTKNPSPSPVTTTTTSFNLEFYTPWMVKLTWPEVEDTKEYDIYSDMHSNQETVARVSGKLNYFYLPASISGGLLGGCWSVKTGGGEFLGRACLSSDGSGTVAFITTWQPEEVTGETSEIYLLREGYEHFHIKDTPAGNPAPVTAEIKAGKGIKLYFPDFSTEEALSRLFLALTPSYLFDQGYTFPYATTYEILRCNLGSSDCISTMDYYVIDFTSEVSSYFDPITYGSYCYRVLGFNSFGTSGFSNTVCADIRNGDVFSPDYIQRVPVWSLEEKIIEISKNNLSLATEMDKVLTGDPKLFQFRIAKTSLVDQYHCSVTYAPSFTEGVYNEIFYKSFKLLPPEYNWNQLEPDINQLKFYNSGDSDLGFLFSQANRNLPTEASDNFEHFKGYFYFKTIMINDESQWDPGFYTYVNPATFGVDFSKEFILILYFNGFSGIMWGENYFYFFKPRGAYLDEKGVLHIVFSSVEGNYPRKAYIEGDCILISYPVSAESPLSLAEEAFVLPRTVLDQDGRLPPLKLEWEFYGENGDGLVVVK